MRSKYSAVTQTESAKTQAMYFSPYKTNDDSEWEQNSITYYRVDSYPWRNISREIPVGQGIQEWQSLLDLNSVQRIGSILKAVVVRVVPNGSKAIGFISIKCESAKFVLSFDGQFSRWDKIREGSVPYSVASYICR